MGNPKFKLSDIVPHAWFYKLKDMNRTTSSGSVHPNKKNNMNGSLPSSNSKKLAHQQPGHLTGSTTTAASLPPLKPRKSYYFPRDLSPGLRDPPQRSSKQGRTPKKSSKPKPKPKPAAPFPPLKPAPYNSSASFSCRASTDSVWTRTEDANASPDSIFDSSSPEFRLDRVLTPKSLGSCGSKIDPVAGDPDIIIHVDENSFVRKPAKRLMGHHNFDSLPNVELPPIVTKPAKPKQNYGVDHVQVIEDDRYTKKPIRKVRENISSRKSVSRRCSISSSPRVRLKINSPRLPSRRAGQARRTVSGGSDSSSAGRRKLSDSFAIMKSSFDPQRDFRESMVEMIVEHNIKASKDLEELLACYLSLNSDEYHELIIEVFKQIWLDLTDIDSLQVVNQ
ncbi:transcription repressor OFP1-like [Punica granatum]|uniref:Transcription repressor n=2 Tax=Punica granatum TaxID=22663 RepID=A0A218XAA3_PUNGR|nr:transcription repressor OFP1-like [Punica granatum]OWM81640.1 hypothetical protein CDL15_Pgr007678 [Punica granatum]PKI62929.1 hypothetical protein CRG98_016688 [Punica granatum]